jgi:hypothetical protein
MRTWIQRLDSLARGRGNQDLVPIGAPKMAVGNYKIYVEYNFHSNPLGQTHDYIQYGSVAQFLNKSTARHP